MPRLRKLHLGTRTVGDITEEQYILILDRVTPAEAKNVNTKDLESSGIPPIAAFGFTVDLPGVDAGRLMTPDTTHTDACLHLVLGATLMDANATANDMGLSGSESTWIIGADREPALPLGLINPKVTRTPAYTKLVSVNKGRIETELRRAAATRTPDR